MSTKKKEMTIEEKQEYSKWTGLMMIIGLGLGYSLGLLIDSISAPLFGAIGGGLGIVVGSIIGHNKIVKKE